MQRKTVSNCPDTFGRAAPARLAVPVPETEAQILRRRLTARIDDYEREARKHHFRGEFEEAAQKRAAAERLRLLTREAPIEAAG